MYSPKNPGITRLLNIPISEILPFIHWTFFFMAWRLNGKYDQLPIVFENAAHNAEWLGNFKGIEREKAHEAYKLYSDAQKFLQAFAEAKSVTVNAVVGIFKAASQADDIVVWNDKKKYIIPTLRQQQPATDGYCYALSDFLKPEDDCIGVFANTIIGGEEMAAAFEKQDDVYNAILIKTLCDRLAEATSEWLHYKIRTEIWGYAPNEVLDVSEMFKTHYQGIRPAVGYPSLPDQSIIFTLDKLIDYSSLGIHLTENGAMYPNASVTGLVFDHPKSKYFNIGKIDEQQFADYAQRSAKTPQEMRKWLAANF